jgi:hypothetical protein
VPGLKKSSWGPLWPALWRNPAASWKSLCPVTDLATYSVGGSGSPSLAVTIPTLLAEMTVASRISTWKSLELTR